MKQIKDMSQAELAAYIQDTLEKDGIKAVLSGGSAVSFYSSDKYVSKDLDLINISFARRSKINSVMETLGFKKKEGISLILKLNVSLNFLRVRFRWERSR